MDATATLTDIKFNEAKRGYDPVEVDNFLEKLGDAVVKLQDKVREAGRRADEAATRATTAEQRATELERRALDAEAKLAAGGGEAPADEAELTETLKKTLLLAQRTADDTVREATDEAERLRTEGRQQAARMVDEANRDAARRLAEAEADLAAKTEQESQELVAQITKLESLRDDLLADVELLDTHLASVRESLAVGVADLTELVEHPERLRARDRPTLRRPAEVSAATDTQMKPATAEAAADQGVDGGGEKPKPASADPGVSAEPAAAATVTEPTLPPAAVPARAKEGQAKDAPAKEGQAKEGQAKEGQAKGGPIRAALDPSDVGPSASSTSAGRQTPSPPRQHGSGARPGEVPTPGGAGPSVPPRPAASPDQAESSSSEAGKPRPAPFVFGRAPAGKGQDAAAAGSAASPVKSAPGEDGTGPVEDAGPPTQPIDLTEGASPDDGFLDELRRAVDEDNPLGPGDPDADAAMQAFFEQDRDDLPKRGRFGRRR